MEEVRVNDSTDITQAHLQFSAPKVKYTKTSRFKCRRAYDGKEFGQTLVYRCTCCGKFKCPAPESRCEKCIKQIDLFLGEK